MTTIAEKTESSAKAEHTPTPWSLTGWSIYEIYGGEDCRLGKVATCPNTADRDFILRACNSFDTTLAAMKQARSALAVLAQSDPTYEPAWRALTDAIKLAEA